MGFEDFFKPYSSETRGDLEAYLREYDCGFASNHFFGAREYTVIRDKGWIVPGVSWVRVGSSPAPDIAYGINSKFMLTSDGPGPYNMSHMGAPKGVYAPEKALKGRHWTIYLLNLPREG
ncbi:MAG: hypothetical protein AABX53_03900 [Nanoarchaeota archaeon]